MRRGLTIAGVCLGLLCLSRPVLAGPYGDDLSKCLVKSTSDEDKNFLIKWMFAGAALHPQVSSIANVTDEQRGELSKSAAKLVERLLTESCKTETTAALKYEGTTALNGSFQVLGQVAAQGLFTHPSVATFLSDFANYVDKEKMQKLVGPQP